MPVSRELADALEDRLDATSSEFRSMRNRILEARVLLIVVGLLQIALTLFIYFSSPDALDDSIGFAAGVMALANCVVAIGMLVAAHFARRRPVDTILAVVFSWAAVQVLGVVIDPLSLFRGLVVKAAFVFILGRGFVAARQAETILRDLAAQASSAG